MPIECKCVHGNERAKKIAITGGPGAGKTALLEVVRRRFCRHVCVLPESASILFSGGFPRGHTVSAECAAQRAIYHVQVELERMAEDEHAYSVILCDRGTLDADAYWPPQNGSFFDDLATTPERELGRYDVVIHLRTPRSPAAYNHQNPVRIESLAQAAAIDDKIALTWGAHPCRIVIEHTQDFLEKINTALAAIESSVPKCCHPNADEGNTRHPR